MAIYWPTPGLKGRTFKLCVLIRWDFNFCVRSSPLRGPHHVKVRPWVQVTEYRHDENESATSEWMTVNKNEKERQEWFNQPKERKKKKQERKKISKSNNSFSRLPTWIYERRILRLISAQLKQPTDGLSLFFSNMSFLEHVPVYRSQTECSRNLI